jgi:hypothetical protein
LKYHSGWEEAGGVFVVERTAKIFVKMSECPMQHILNYSAFSNLLFFAVGSGQGVSKASEF